jgi:acyl carrier protein
MSIDECPEAHVGAIGQLIAEKRFMKVGSPEDDLLATGVLDSLTLIQLLVHLEERFGIRIPLNELQIEDVQSISAMARLVANHRFTHASAGRGT